MEDIVGVEVRLADGQRRYFPTWGRIQDTVEPRPLEEIVLRNASAFALGGDPVSAQVLLSLKPASTAPSFLECFFQMCQRPIPIGPDYGRWREDSGTLAQAGEENAATRTASPPAER